MSGLPRVVCVVVPLDHTHRDAQPRALATAHRGLDEAAATLGGRVDWDTLEVRTGPLLDLLDNTARDDLSGLRACAMVHPL